MGLITKLNESFGDTTLPQIRRDDFLSGDNNGVLFLADFGDAFSWREGTGTPTNGDIVYDIAEKNNGIITNVLPSAAGATANVNAAGYLDYSVATSSPFSGARAAVQVPAAVSAALWNTGGANEHQYSFTMYGKFLDYTSWDTDASIEQFMGSSPAYTGDGIFLAALQSGNTLAASIRRDTGSGAQLSQSGGASGARFGNHVSNAVTQFIVHTHNNEFRWRYKTANYSITGGSSTRTTITHNYSSAVFQFGHGTSFGGDPKPLKRLYRMSVEDLTVSGRDPIVVADADWNRNISRFS